MNSVFSKKALLGLAFSLFVPLTLMAEERLYPTANQTPLVVGTEEFEDNYASLAGLEGVHVVTRYVSRSAKKHKLTDLKADLVDQIGKRLAGAGIRMLDKQDLTTTPGQPTLTFYPGYSGSGLKPGLPLNARIAAENETSTAEGACRSSMWASFLQSATILRSPNKQFKFITWGSGDSTNDCENRGAWTYDAVLTIVDKFVADYKRAESENESEANLKSVSHVNEVPEDCAQPWSLRMAVFDTDLTRIKDSAKPILDRFAQRASDCMGYRYIIKTYADHSQDPNFNQVLSEARAHTIKDYLLQKNVSHDRLETVAFGEYKPSTGNAVKKDGLVNPSVVITPQP